MISDVTIAHGALNYLSSSRIEKEKFFVSILHKLVSNTDSINDSFVFIFFFSRGQILRFPMTEGKQKENYFVTLQALKQKIKHRLSRGINCTIVNCVTFFLVHYPILKTVLFHICWSCFCGCMQTVRAGNAPVSVDIWPRTFFLYLGLAIRELPLFSICFSSYYGIPLLYYSHISSGYITETDCK